MKLYGYWRSSATYRVRIALALKRLDYDYQPVNLLKGEQLEDHYRKVSPQGLVPAFVTDDGAVLTQSMAIIAYLEEIHPSPSLLPSDPVARARAREIALALAIEAQPLQNLRIQKYLRNEAGLSEEALQDWLNRWPGGAMRAVDEMIGVAGGKFCVGDAPTIADIFLVPQVYAALRFKIDLDGLDRLNRVYEHCIKLEAFRKAHPDNQPDAVKG